MTAGFYTTKEAADLLESSVYTVRTLCSRHGIGKLFGNVRILEDGDIENLRRRKGKVGRPKKENA